MSRPGRRPPGRPWFLSTSVKARWEVRGDSLGEEDHTI
jgi:hypothetical protein